MHTGAGLAGDQDARVEERRFRLLAWAVLASLVLHALILLSLSQLREFGQSRATPPPLIARLVKPKPPDPPPPKLEPVAAARVAPRPAPVAKSRPQPAAPVRAPTVAPPPPLLSVEPQKQAAEPVFVVPAAPASPLATTDSEPGPGTPTSPVTGADPGSIARFRLEVMGVASRYKRYPRIAQDNNWEGRVELRIAISEVGAISSISVKKGTGRAVLDEEAQTMIRRALPLTGIPPALRGKAFTLEIPVDFSLREEK
jgi:protein TonB